MPISIRINRRRQLLLYPHCQLCPIIRGGGSPAVEVHHILGRTGRDCHDRRNLLSVCRACHDHVGRHNGGKALSLLAKMESEGAVDLDFLSELSDINVRWKLREWCDLLGPEHGIVTYGRLCGDDTQDATS